MKYESSQACLQTWTCFESDTWFSRTERASDPFARLRTTYAHASSASADLLGRVDVRSVPPDLQNTILEALTKSASMLSCSQRIHETWPAHWPSVHCSFLRTSVTKIAAMLRERPREDLAWRDAVTMAWSLLQIQRVYTFDAADFFEYMLSAATGIILEELGVPADAAPAHRDPATHLAIVAEAMRGRSRAPAGVRAATLGSLSAIASRLAPAVDGDVVMMALGALSDAAQSIMAAGSGPAASCVWKEVVTNALLATTGGCALRVSAFALSRLLPLGPNLPDQELALVMVDGMVCSMDAVVRLACCDDAYVDERYDDPVTTLVTETLQCGMLQHLASADMMRVMCGPSGRPTQWSHLSLVPELFCRLALSLTECITHRVAATYGDSDAGAEVEDQLSTRAQRA
jgi:hypothetical protein